MHVCMYVCRLLTRIRRTCYTIENKITKIQLSKKQKRNIIHKKQCNYEMKQIRHINGDLIH